MFGGRKVIVKEPNNKEHPQAASVERIKTLSDTDIIKERLTKLYEEVEKAKILLAAQMYADKSAVAKPTSKYRIRRVEFAPGECSRDYSEPREYVGSGKTAYCNNGFIIEGWKAEDTTNSYRLRIGWDIAATYDLESFDTGISHSIYFHPGQRYFDNHSCGNRLLAQDDVYYLLLDELAQAKELARQNGKLEIA